MAEKIRAGHVHESGCTGCLVALADNYEGLLKILDRYVDWVYDLTLVDTRHIPKMDVVLIEGSAGYLELAVNCGSAADATGLERGDRVVFSMRNDAP